MNCGLKCNIHEHTSYSVVHVEVIQFICWTLAINLSCDRVDFLHVRYWCWRLWKLCGHFLLPALELSKFPEFLDATGFTVTSFWWLLQDSESENSQDAWLLSVAAPLSVTSTINPPRYASFSLPWELDAASGFEYPLRFPCRCSEYHQAFRRSRMVHGWGTCRDSGSQVHRHRLWFCQIPVFFPCFGNYFRFVFLSSNSMLVFSQVFPIIVHCCLCIWYFHCLKQRNKFVH